MTISSFNQIPETGVIKMMSLAREAGFFYGNSEWANWDPAAILPTTWLRSSSKSMVLKFFLQTRKSSAGVCHIPSKPKDMGYASIGVCLPPG